MPKRVLFAAALLLMSISLSAQDAEQIILRNSKTLVIPSLQGSFSVELISAKGDVRQIKARAFQKYTGRKQNNRLFIFDFPPTVRGTGLLLHSFFDERENNMWIYLPAIRRVKRIALESSGGGYFMGSDFTYRDLIDNDYRDMKLERRPDQVVDGIDSYVVRAQGKTLQLRQDHGYDHIVTYYRKDNYMVHRREYFDLSGKLLKVYKVENFLVLDPHIYPNKISMTNVQTGHRSKLIMEEVSTEEIPDRYFTTRFLQSGRFD
jgi:hypothetical protein